MSSLVVGGVVIPVAISSPAWTRSDAVDRGRLFDGTFFASESGGATRDWNFSTTPVTQADADTYIAALGSPAAKLCSGDILQIPTMCSPELPSGKPTRAASSNRVVLDFMLHEIQPSKVLLRYAPGDTITGESFTRSTTGTYVNSSAVSGSAAINVKRDSHYINSVRTILLEGARENACVRSGLFTAAPWADAGTPTNVSDGTDSGVELFEVGDDNAAAREGYEQNIVFTGNGLKAINLRTAQGTSTSSVFRLRDTTAAANRLLGALTWSAGLPVLVMTTGTYLGYEVLNGSVFRLKFATTSVTAANTNELGLYSATDAALSATPTGTLTMGAVQAENAAFGSSYFPTTTAALTRGADSYSLPFTATPGEMSVYVKFVELGTIGTSGARVFEISSSGDADPRLVLYNEGTNYRALHGVGAVIVNSTQSTPPVIGDTVELLVRLYGDGSVDLTQSINGGTATTATQSAALALGAAWAGSLLWLNSVGATNVGFTALQSLKVVAGSRSIVEMRAA